MPEKSSITGIFGNLGEGKTLLDAYFANKHIDNGWATYTNFGLHGSQDLLSLMDLRTIGDCFVGIDDIVVMLDSRLYTSNVAVTWLLNLARKSGLRIVYTAQVLSAVDLRLRHITNIIIMTKQLRFPYFKIKVFDQEGNQYDKKTIKYLPKTYNSFDTNRKVFQVIKIEELYKLLDISKNQTMFKPLIQGRYNISSTVAGPLYTALQDENLEYIEQILWFNGYLLYEAGVDVDGEGGREE